MLQSDTLVTSSSVGDPARRLKPHGPPEVRFWAKVRRGSSDECWLWTGYIGREGYGYFQFSTKNARKAHRVSWELANGPLPPGAGYHGTCVLHRCDVRHCVNPAHLFLGSNADNMADMVAKGRAKRGEAHFWAKLTEAAAREIIVRYAGGGESHRSLAAKYGVTKSTITNVLSGRTWV